MTRILFFILFILIPLNNAHSDTPEVASNVSVNDRVITKLDLVRIFTRKNGRWSDGHKITVFIKGIDSLENKLFIIDVLNLTPYKFQSMVDSVVYSGRNTPPIELSSDAEMYQRLSSTPYSIGYFNYMILVNDSDSIVEIQYD